MNFQLKFLQHLLKDKTQGLTIIECLLAIIIVTILIVAIGPVLAFAAATRINARRVELASQSATAYLDSVRTGSVELPPLPASLPPPDRAVDALSQVAAPTALNCSPANISSYDGYCSNPDTSATSILYCVDRNTNGSCNTADDRQDFIIQVARVPSPNPNAFLLGTRVYRADAFLDGVPLKTTKSPDGKKSSVLAGGTGNKSAPVIELITEVIPPS